MFDGQLVRPPQSFRDAAQNYVCVRIVNIDDADINLYPFDYDLTLAVVLANADGTVYHRYGGRDNLSPMNMGTLVRLMEQGLPTHEKYMAQPHPPKLNPPQRLSELVHEQLQDEIKPIYGCYHCHYVREARQHMSLKAGQWSPDQFWIWPLPKTVGLTLDPQRQNQVAHITAGSPADAAGIRDGDLIQFLNGTRMLTQYDTQWILDQTPAGSTSFPFTLLRANHDAPLQGQIKLDAGWKVGDPEDYLWRVKNVFTEHMIKFLPAPGFIGRRLNAAEQQLIGLVNSPFALRVTQLNYGTHQAGIRIGDVILSAAGRAEYASTRDFYRWCESLRTAGRDIRMELMRLGARMQVMVSQDALNHSRVEKSPRVHLGFIVQELPGNAGLRVGNVTDDSSAEKTGLRIGDRITAMDGVPVPSRGLLEGHLGGKFPGDLLTLDVTRDGRPLQFGYVLPGEQENRSDVARLSGVAREAGQELTCTVSIHLPPGKHIYSVHKDGFGLPTQLEFRGRGYELSGAVEEPEPRQVMQEGLEPMWILEGPVDLRQRIVVTDPGRFQLALRVYAQVCDDKSCHEFQAIIGNHGTETGFTEFRGRFEGQPPISAKP